MNKIELPAEERVVFGRKVKLLRKQGLIPANIFGNKVKSKSISVNKKEFDEVFEKAGETSLITLVLKEKGNKKDERAVLVSNIQNNPVTDEVVHVDFHQVNLKEKVTAQIPVELQGESSAEKTGLGTVVQYINEIEVEALPQDLPENFVVDTSALTEVDQAVQVKDLAYDRSKIEIVDDQEEIVAKVEPLREEEEEPAVAQEAEVDEEAVEQKETEEEGEQQQEGSSEEQK